MIAIAMERVRIGDVGAGHRLCRGYSQCRLLQRQAVGAADYLPPARRQHHRDRRPHPAVLPQLKAAIPQAIKR